MKSLPQLTHCITLSRRSHAWRLKRVSCWTGWLARPYPQTRAVEANTKGLTRPQPYKLSEVDWKSGMSQCEAQSGCPNGSAFISWDMTLAHEYTVWRGDYSSPPMIWNAMTNHRTEDWIDIGYKRLHDAIIDWIWHLSLSWLEFLENCQVLLFWFLSFFCFECICLWLLIEVSARMSEHPAISKWTIWKSFAHWLNWSTGLVCETVHLVVTVSTARLWLVIRMSARRLYQICNHQTDQTSYTST